MKEGMAVLVALIMTFVAGNAYSVEYEQMKTPGGHTEDVQSVSFSRDGKLTASGSNDKTVILWDTDTWKQVNTFEGHERDVQVRWSGFRTEQIPNYPCKRGDKAPHFA